MLLLTLAENSPGYLTDTMALAAVALVGYLFGQRTRKAPDEKADEKLILELSRAAHIARELHSVALRIRQDVASHQSNILQFESRVDKLKSNRSADGWQSLSDEAEALLSPTMEFASKLTLAYDQLRKQSTLLMNFAGSRSDLETGVHNRRAMEEQLEILFSHQDQNGGRFALSLFSIETRSSDPLRSTDSPEDLLRFATILESCARDSDLVARYSMDEFVVIMPQTSMAGATLFSDRLLQRIDAELDSMVCGGIVEVLAEDSPEKLLSRADSALYSARASEASRLYQHNGKAIRSYDAELSPGFEKPSEVENEPPVEGQELVEAAEADAFRNGHSPDY